MSATHTETQTPSVRVRIAHSKTIKDGWGYESSVEVIIPGASASNADGLLELNATLQDLLDLAREHGERERDLRNARDGRTA